MSAEQKLKKMGLILPAALQAPAGMKLPFVFVRVLGERAIIAGHLPQEDDGSIARVRGKVGSEVSLEEAQLAARKVGLSILGSLQRELGSLDRIVSWVKLLGMVNVAPGFNQLPAVINGCSDLILEVFGEEIGTHARSAVGLAELPFGASVEIEGEVLISI